MVDMGKFVTQSECHLEHKEVIKELHETEIKILNELSSINARISMLEVKSSVWGAVGGFISAAIMWLMSQSK